VARQTKATRRASANQTAHSPERHADTGRRAQPKQETAERIADLTRNEGQDPRKRPLGRKEGDPTGKPRQEQKNDRAKHFARPMVARQLEKPGEDQRSARGKDPQRRSLLNDLDGGQVSERYRAHGDAGNQAQERDEPSHAIMIAIARRRHQTGPYWAA